MKNLVEGKHGHGALPKKWDARDHKYSKLSPLGRATSPYMWVDTQVAVPPPVEIITEDQGGSSSCGGQSLRYKAEYDTIQKTGKFERLSAKNPYSQIFVSPSGGCRITDIGKIYANKGVSSEELVPSYQNGYPPSDSFMQDKSLNGNAVNNAQTHMSPLGYAFPSTNIDSLAQAARDNNGGILQVSGCDGQGWRTTFPMYTSTWEWSHFLFFPKDSSQMINGKKGMWIKNTWGDDVGSHGWQWLSEEFFKGGVNNAIVFYNKNDYLPYNPNVWQKFLMWFQQYWLKV